ncbi:MAG: hypothetical protein ACLQUY_03680 [Ktedonobacterales bacterium]
MSTKEATQTATSNRWGRRAAIAAAAAAGACGITALAAPRLVTDVEHGAENLGRQALAHELDALETISLDDAIRAAEITKAAVQVIVVPLARLVALIGGDALGILLASLNAATNVFNTIHVNVAALSALRSTVADWHTNIASLPIALTSYTTANIDNAETYLKALKKSTQAQ